MAKKKTIAEAKGLTSDELFFYNNAGYSYPSGATKAQKERARKESARDYARAERWASEHGYTFDWKEEEEDWSSFLGDQESLDDISEVLYVVMKDSDGNVVQSLGGVSFGHDRLASRSYARTVEAELAREEMGDAKRRASAPRGPRSNPRTVGDDLEDLEERILTYEDFAREHGITMTCERISTPPSRRDWGAGSTHWKCHLKRGKKKMQITYSMGSALKPPPKIKDVLYSIAADASSYESAGGDYHSFLEEFGNEDEAEQRRTWASLKKQNASLMRLLDDDQDLYNALLYNTREEYER